jgi:hypothetical protein
VTTVAEIDRVQALVKRLNALGSMQRGDLIRAQQWNDLVGLMVEIAQRMLEGTSEEVPPHEHPDQVKATWLSPSLRSLVEKGPLADPAATSRVTDVEGRLRTLSEDLDKLRATVTTAGDRLSEMSTRELTRESDSNEIRLMVGSLSERRDDVLELRKTLGSIGEKVDKALEASSRLVIDGKPVDMNDLNRRIVSVEELRTSLTGPGGQLLDAAEIEKRLATLRNTLVTQEQLELALKQRPIELDENALDGIRESVAVKLREETRTSFATLSTEIRNETATKLNGIDGLVAQRIEERVPERIEVEAGKLRAETKAQVDGALAASRAFAEGATGAATETLRSELAQKIGAVQAEVSSRIASEIANILPTILLPLEDSVSAARAQAVALAAKLDELSFALQDARGRIEQVALETGESVRTTRDALLSEIDRRDATQRQTYDKRFQELEARFDTRFVSVDASLIQFQDAASDKITARAVAAASDALRMQIVQLQAQMEEIARSQSLGLQDQVTQAVWKQLDTDLDRRITEIVKGTR